MHGIGSSGREQEGAMKKEAVQCSQTPEKAEERERERAEHQDSILAHSAQYTTSRSSTTMHTPESIQPHPHTPEQTNTTNQPFIHAKL